MLLSRTLSSFFFFNDTATTEIYTLSLHDALPILTAAELRSIAEELGLDVVGATPAEPYASTEERSEEHTSELQSRLHLVCRLLLEKKKKKQRNNIRRRDTEPNPCVHASGPSAACH